MQMRDLNAPAEVRWNPKPDLCADSRLFPSLREAISFVMKEMPAQQRGTAVINVDGQQTLQIDEIEQMYRHPDFATTGAQ